MGSHQQTRPSSAVAVSKHKTPPRHQDTFPAMSEDHFDQWEYYNFEEKLVTSRNSGKQRSKKEAALNTNRHSPGGHERKIVTKLRNTERNKKQRKQSKQSACMHGGPGGAPMK